jgi:hypothetical protein
LINLRGEAEQLVGHLNFVLSTQQFLERSNIFFKFFKPTWPGTSNRTLSFPDSVFAWKLEAAFTVEIKRAIRSHQISECPIPLLAAKTAF